MLFIAIADTMRESELRRFWRPTRKGNSVSALGSPEPFLFWRSWMAAPLAILRRLLTGRGRNAVRYVDTPAQADFARYCRKQVPTYDAADPR